MAIPGISRSQFTRNAEPKRRAGRGPREQSAEKRRQIAAVSLHYGQSQLWSAAREFERSGRYRIISAFAGTGGGKTWYGPRHWYPFIRRNPEATYLFIEPTYRMLKRVLLPIVEEFFGAFNLGTMYRGDMIYELHTGGRILFASIDNPNSLQGVHIDGGIWCDEIGLYSEEAWDVILQRSAYYRAPILNTSTPYTLPWVEKRLHKPSKDRRTADEYYSLQFPSHWNPSYPLDQFFALKRAWPKDKFERLMLGQFTRIGGLVFEEFDEQRNVAEIYPLPTPPGADYPLVYFRHPLEGERKVELIRTWAAQDWGYSADPGCQLLLGQDAAGRIYCFEEDYDKGVPVERGTDRGEDTWAARALTRCERYGIDALFCDPSDPEAIDSMRAHGVPAVKAYNKILPGIDRVNEAFRPHKRGGAGLYISVTCPNLLRTIGSYVRQKIAGTDEYKPSPSPNQEDHALDTLRYSLASGDDDSGGNLAPVTLIGAQRGTGKGRKPGPRF
jgi:hypothetical protein